MTPDDSDAPDASDEPAAEPDEPTTGVGAGTASTGDDQAGGLSRAGLAWTVVAVGVGLLVVSLALIFTGQVPPGRNMVRLIAQQATTVLAGPVVTAGLIGVVLAHGSGG